jgi:hypothetical protein
MKRIIQLVVALLIGLSAGAAMPQTTGGPLNLNIPAQGTPSWGTLINNNFVTLNTTFNNLMPNTGVLVGVTPLTTRSALASDIVALWASCTSGYLQFNGTCSTPAGGVTTVFGRAGAVTAANGDYNFSQIDGTLVISQLPTPTASYIAGAGTLTNSISGNAATATAAAAAGTACSTGQAPTGVDINWNAIGCQSITGGGGSVLTAPTGSQTVTQNSGTYFNVNYMNHRVWADGFPGTCSGGTVQADCAYIGALNLSNSTGNSTVLLFGALNGYTKCNEWLQPTGGFWGVDIIGSGMGATFIRQTCSIPTSPMIAKLGTTGAYFILKDITFDANNDAGSCFDYLAGVAAGGEISHVACQNVLPTATSGLDHYVQVGNHSASVFAEDVDINTLSIQPPYGINPTTFATLVANMSGTSLSTVTVSAGGSYSTGQQAVAKAGVNDPHSFCSVLPVLGTPTFSTLAVATVPVISGGTCSAAPDIYVIPQVQVTYGAKLDMSDSTVTHLEAASGITGSWAFGANTVYTHIHCILVQNCIEIQGGGSYNGTEADTVASVVFKIDNTSTAKGISFTNSSAVTQVGGQHLPGGVIWQFPTSTYAANIAANNQLCPGNAASPDYQEFTVAGAGPVAPGATGWPTGVSVYGNDQTCTNMGTNMNRDYAVNLGAGNLFLPNLLGQSLLGTDANGNVIAGSTGAATARWVSGSCTGVQSGTIAAGFTNFGGGTACATAASTTTGFLLPPAAGSISAATLRCYIGGLNTTSGTVTLFYSAPGLTTRSAIPGFSMIYGTTAAGTAVSASAGLPFSYAANGVITASMATQSGETLGACVLGISY